MKQEEKKRQQVLVETTKDCRENIRKIAKHDGRQMNKVIELAIKCYAERIGLKL